MQHGGLHSTNERVRASSSAAGTRESTFVPIAGHATFGWWCRGSCDSNGEVSVRRASVRSRGR